MNSSIQIRSNIVAAQAALMKIAKRMEAHAFDQRLLAREYVAIESEIDQLRDQLAVQVALEGKAL